MTMLQECRKSCGQRHHHSPVVRNEMHDCVRRCVKQKVAAYLRSKGIVAFSSLGDSMNTGYEVTDVEIDRASVVDVEEAVAA